uniref:Uncharacterized protein n=1 Tax=Schistosoma curassoni TaxID=6186 RepID=A0A183JPZ2_9TREM
LNIIISQYFFIKTKTKKNQLHFHFGNRINDKEKLLLSVVRQELIKTNNKQKKKLSTEQTLYQINSMNKELPKIKGPFKNPEEVKKWINKPINLSLRVSTDYFSLEKSQQIWKSKEWSNRLHDNK